MSYHRYHGLQGRTNGEHRVLQRDCRKGPTRVPILTVAETAELGPYTALYITIPM